MAEQAPKLSCRPEVLALVPECLAREVDAFPLDHSGNKFTFAVARPLSWEESGKLAFVLNGEIRELIHPIEAIRKALDDNYGEANPIEHLVFYYPGSATILDNDTIEMGASGWDSGQGQQSHWTGCTSFSVNDPDYGLWRWIISQGARFSQVVSRPVEDPLGEWPAHLTKPIDLDSIRESYRREVRPRQEKQEGHALRYRPE